MELLQVPSQGDQYILYGYPATSHFVRHQSGAGEVHTIWGTDEDPATNHANAPNGSEYIVMTATAGSMKVYKKFGATFGAKDGTWVVISV